MEKLKINQLEEKPAGNMVIDPNEVVATVEKIDDIEYFIRKTFDTDPSMGCELLFKNYYQPLCSHAVRFVFSKSVAEDLVSEIFYQFYQKKTYLTITTSYRAYLYKCVRNSAYNYLRWESRRVSPLECVSDYSDLSSAQPDSVTQYEDLYNDVEKAINGLPPQRQKIYLMHRFEGKKYKEISEELNLSERTVEVQIRKASHSLRYFLKRKWTLTVLLILLEIF